MTFSLRPNASISCTLLNAIWISLFSKAALMSPYMMPKYLLPSRYLKMTHMIEWLFEFFYSLGLYFLFHQFLLYEKFLKYIFHMGFFIYLFFLILVEDFLPSLFARARTTSHGRHQNQPGKMYTLTWLNRICSRVSAGAVFPLLVHKASALYNYVHLAGATCNSCTGKLAPEPAQLVSTLVGN